MQTTAFYLYCNSRHIFSRYSQLESKQSPVGIRRFPAVYSSWFVVHRNSAINAEQHKGESMKESAQRCHTPLGAENNIKELKRQRKIPPAQDWGLYKKTTHSVGG